VLFIFYRSRAVLYLYQAVLIGHQNEQRFFCIVWCSCFAFIENISRTSVAVQFSAALSWVVRKMAEKPDFLTGAQVEVPKDDEAATDLKGKFSIFWRVIGIKAAG